VRQRRQRRAADGVERVVGGARALAADKIFVDVAHQVERARAFPTLDADGRSLAARPGDGGTWVARTAPRRPPALPLGLWLALVAGGLALCLGGAALGRAAVTGAALAVVGLGFAASLVAWDQVPAAVVVTVLALAMAVLHGRGSLTRLRDGLVA